METWIQPCVECANLHGQPAVTAAHANLALNGAGAVNDQRVEECYACSRCGAVFARILAGAPSRQIWMLLNAGQH